LDWVSGFDGLKVEDFDEENKNVLGVIGENLLTFNHVLGVANVTLDFKQLFDV
jgi:hypothetical protein